MWVLAFIHYTQCLPYVDAPNLPTDGVPDTQAAHEGFYSIRTLKGYYGVTAKSNHSLMESLCTQLRAHSVTHALFSMLPCFRSPYHAIDGVVDTQTARKRFHLVQTFEGYYGVTSESSHSRMESLCTQLSVGFGVHPLYPMFALF